MTEIEKAALAVYPINRKPNNRGTGDYDCNRQRRMAFIEGAEWHKVRIKGDIIDEMETFIYHHLNYVGDMQCNNVEALIADIKERIELLTN